MLRLTMKINFSLLRILNVVITTEREGNVLGLMTVKYEFVGCEIVDCV